MRCATHPAVETHLRCATCGIPICPDCMVETPVGMKCREHGLAPPPPQYRVSLAGYGAAVLAGLVLAAVAGALVLRLPSILITLAVGLVGGHFIGEAVSYSSGWRRGPRLAAVAAATIVVGVLAGGMVLIRVWYGVPPTGPADLLQGIAQAPRLWIAAALTSLIAYWRLR